ncbi:PLP-dependent transferase [Candidatus Marinarcus aquaticus]|uniref:Cystathionine gamma-synthase n=1 Tax=Candidatus Marinarcus aquaticus TaxID=2044504 RepID=A0A4Q0XU54_9BACT|nr:PLP-dependent transferase [Candidatus Marinarcus aquaticus]RXJ57941.1 cystathionine gamma-synthase [Candidatus Marinarcus aquaticus]
MSKTTFKPIACGATLPVNNIHAVSVSIPTLREVIDYEEGLNGIHDKIKSGYPRFMLHPYLKLMAQYLKTKYNVPSCYEVVLLSSKKAVKLVSDTYFIHNPFKIDEPFGVILVLNETSQLQKVLSFIQHVGCNLSSRFAQKYLYEHGVIDRLHQEELLDTNIAKTTLLNILGKAYKQPVENIALAPSGMNAVYGVLKGLKSIQNANSRNILVQFGWLYLDTMNVVKHYFKRNRVFYDIHNKKALEKYLKSYGKQVSAIVTEVPTNPLVQTVDIKWLKNLCDAYNIPLVIDSTLATPYNVDLKPYADIFIESLTKFACGNADVLMGAIILNENSRFSCMQSEFFKHCDEPYIQDIQRISYEIRGYEARMKKINHNTKLLVEYLEKQPYVKTIYHTHQEKCKANYQAIQRDDSAFGGLISVVFHKPFDEVYDQLNFAKGPSLGTEFTLLMPYVYLAHYDMIQSKEGQAVLKAFDMDINLLRISVGCEDIEEIKKEFDKLL